MLKPKKEGTVKQC